MRKLTMKNWNVLDLWYGWMEDHGNKRVHWYAGHDDDWLSRETVICGCNVDWLSSYNDDWLSEYGRSPWHYSKVKYGR